MTEIIAMLKRITEKHETFHIVILYGDGSGYLTTQRDLDKELIEWNSEEEILSKLKEYYDA